MKYLLIFAILGLTSCGHKKLVVKNCEKAEHADLYICERL